MINYVSSSFDLFGLTIHWYAVCILIGIVLAVVAGVREGKKNRYSKRLYLYRTGHCIAMRDHRGQTVVCPV